ncbi:MAG: hypothetical protein ACRES2_03870 [Steroidobacteraceae bacterium]
MKAFANRAMAGLLIAVCCSFLASPATYSAAPAYPGWAAAVVPVYPNMLPSGNFIIPTMYNIATTDSFPTVVAWYKSRVQGAWTDSEGGHTWSVKTGGVRIQVSENYFDDSGNQKPGTRVAITKVR